MGGFPLGGDLLEEVIPIPSPDLFAEQNDGRRPALPWTIAAFVDSYYAISEDGGSTFKFDELEPFAVLDTFSNDSDDLLTRAGGLAGYIGVIIPSTNGPALRFRPPYAGEVVVRVSDSAVFRWNEDSATWDAHTTLPQRALANARVFGMFDPAGIYDYFAKMLGLMLAQHQYDSRRLLDLGDPVSCPDNLLSLLLATFGADDIEFETNPEGKRELLRTFIGIMQVKGTPGAIVTALASLGYVGYGMHVWAIPEGDPETDFIEKAFGADMATPSDGAADYFPTSQVVIHVNDLEGNPIVIPDSDKDSIARFLVRNVLPAHVIIKWFATDRSAGSDGLTVTDAAAITP